MKRSREAEMVSSSEIKSAINELAALSLNSGGDLHFTKTGQVPLKPFLFVCNLLIQVLEKIGPSMAVLRQDIHQNVKRLEEFYDSDPSKYWDVVEILKKEANEGNARKGPTCSQALVWLSRSLDFTLVLLQTLVKDFQINMKRVVEESYNITLKPWHGWISSAAYKVALRLVPDSQTLINILKAKDQDSDTLKEEIKNLISLLMPVLEQNNDILRAYGLDKLKST